MYNLTSMEGLTPQFEKKFASPQEELEFLRAEIIKKEKALAEKGQQVEREKIIQEGLKNFAQIPVKDKLHENYLVPQHEHEAIVLSLSPEAHDSKIEELVTILQQKGLSNTLAVLEKMNDPHLSDDFHRFLVQYIKAGFTVTDLKEKKPLLKSLKMTLFEVSLPPVSNEEEKGKKMSELISGMEQFYSGMLSVADKEERSAGYFTIELANPNHTNELVFFVSVPDTRVELFEKQIISVFPDAKVLENKDDYNVFNHDGIAVGAYATLTKNPVYSLRTIESFDHDPLSVILNVFSRLNKDGEGASIQLVFKPCSDDSYNKNYQRTLEDLAKGKKLKEAIDHNYSFGHIFGKMIKDAGKDLMTGDEKKEEKAEGVDQSTIENIRSKASSRVVEVNIRLIASAATKFSAETIIANLQSAFNQFDNPFGNNIEFKTVKENHSKEFFKDFSFRNFSTEYILPLNIKELTTMIHLPSNEETNAPHLKQSKASAAPAPIDMKETGGVVLGVNRFRGIEKKICFTPNDRLRHFYVIGQTGTGKTNILMNMINQDIANGDGVCFIDPHGSDIQQILANIPPERYEDVIYFDPSYTDRPMALNMLEYDQRFPIQKTFVVNEMLSIFNKLFDMKTAGGPMFEQYFRNAVMLVIEDPDSGSTLLDVSRVLADASYRKLKLARCKNPIVVQFWREIAEKAGGEASLGNIVPYITSKFDVFLSNEIMRPIVSQQKSVLNFRQIMDDKKILLVNLSKGTLGDINANLIGLIVVGKILMAALSRVDSFGTDLPNFYLYVDEFQNVTTDSISTILSEARKYKLSLNVAHQYISQLQDNIKNAVFGNVGSICAFRVSAEDAEYLEKQFAPVFTAKDLMNVDNYNAYIKMLSGGMPVRPFSIATMAPNPGNKEIIPKLKELSYLKYGQDRAEIEAEIMKKYQKTPYEEPTF